MYTSVQRIGSQRVGASGCYCEGRHKSDLEWSNERSCLTFVLVAGEPSVAWRSSVGGGGGEWRIRGHEVQVSVRVFLKETAREGETDREEGKGSCC